VPSLFAKYTRLTFASSAVAAPLFPILLTTSRFRSDADSQLSCILQSEVRCSAEQIVEMVNSACGPIKVALAASVEPEGAGQEKDSNLLRI
jgi:hypothetical protein